MSIMISKLYDALTEAGSSTHTARQAAQAVANLETRMANIEARMTNIETEIRSIKEQIKMLKWMMGFMMVLLAAILGINFQMYMEVLEILKTASAN